MPRIRSETAAVPTHRRHRGPANVLYVNSIPYLGGAECSLLTLMSHLDRRRYCPYLVTREEGLLSEGAIEIGIPVFAQPFPWLSRRRPWVYGESVWRLVRTIRRNRISLVHTNCDRSLSHVMRACRLARVPYISHVRDCVRSWFYPQHLAALNLARRVIANSRVVADAFVDAGVNAELVEVVYNPVDVARFSQVQLAATIALRRSLGISPGAFLVGLVGQIQPIKGQEEFVRAAAGVAEVVTDAHFLIVGDAFSEPAQAFLRHLERLVHDLNLTTQVHFTGFRDDIPVVMQALDVLAVPSQPEPGDPVAQVDSGVSARQQLPRLRQIGFGRAVIEGMAAGCAVVATQLDGILELLEPGRNGLLVPPGDVGALAEALILLAKDPGLRQRLGAGGRQTAQGFTAEKHSARIQSLYDSVLGISEPSLV
jgi:glycosyltransferase involved in cell wall biosynthesis